MTPLSVPYGDWLTHHDLSANTVRQRLAFLSRIEGEIDPLTATAGDLSLWLGEFEGWTRRTYFSAIRSVMAFLVETGRRVDDPSATLRRNPTPGVRPHPIDLEDEERLLMVARGDDFAALLLGLRAGLRAHEVAKFAGEHLTATRLRVRGKGGKVDVLPTHPDLWALAQRYPRQGLWFPSYGTHGHITSKWVSARASRLFDQVGLDGSFHRLRATFGTTLLRNGTNIKVVQKLMRHESLGSTEHYLGVAEDELSSAIATLGAQGADRLAA